MNNPANYTDRLRTNLKEIPAIVQEHLLSEESILRPKQREAVQRTFDKISNENSRAVAIIMPTGTGKMVIVVRLIAALKSVNKRGYKAKRILFVSDGVEGVLQGKDKMRLYAGFKVGLYYSRQKDFKNDIILTTYQSSQDEYFPFDAKEFDIVILDEAHVGISENRLKALQKYENAIILAFTASPEYSDERSLLNYFELAYKIDIRQAVNEKLVCGFLNILLSSEIKVNLDEIGLGWDGDFNRRTLSKAINSEARNRIGIQYLLFYSHPLTGIPVKDLQGIISCADIQHAKDVTSVLNTYFEAYYPGEAPEHGFVRWISGSCPERENILKWHKEGKIRYLAYANLLNQNYDDKKISVCLNLRLSYSKVLVTQRAGRAARFDEMNLSKVALVIDVVDEYFGKFVRYPLLYSSAVGHTACFIDTFPSPVMAKSAAGIESPFYGNILKVSDELREFMKDATFKVLAREETIMEYLSSRPQTVRKMTKFDLSVWEISKLTSYDIKSIEKSFERITADWVRFNTSPGNHSCPEIKIEEVWRNGQIIPTIPRIKLDRYLKDYFPAKTIREQVPTDAPPAIIHHHLGISIETIEAAMSALEKDWNLYFDDPSVNKRPAIQLFLVATKADTTKPVLAIPISKIHLFRIHYIGFLTVRERKDDDMEWQDVVELTQLGPAVVQKIYAQLKRQWGKFIENPTETEPPPIPLDWIQTGQRIISVVSREYLSLIVNSYYEGEVILNPTEQYLSVSEISEITGYSTGTIAAAFTAIEEEARRYLENTAGKEKPVLKTELIRIGKIVVKCLQKDQINLFIQRLHGNREFYKVQASDVNGIELAKRTGFNRARMVKLLSDIRKQWDEYEAHLPGVEKPAVYVKIARTKRNIKTLVLDNAEVPLLIDNYLKNKMGDKKTDDDLSTKDLMSLTGMGHTIIHDILKQLDSEWENYHKDPDNSPKPMIPIRKVKKSSMVVTAIHLSYLNLFREIYLKKYYERKTITDDLIGARELMGQANCTIMTILKYLKMLEMDWTAFNNRQSKVKPALQIYRVFHGNAETLAIKRKDISLFFSNYFVSSYVKEKSENELSVTEIMNFAKISGKGVIQDALQKVEKDWDEYNKDPEAGSKPPVSILMVKVKNLVMKAIAKDLVYPFLRIYLKDFVSFPLWDPETQFSLDQMCEITGLSKGTVLKYLKVLQDHWERYKESPFTTKKPTIRLRQVRSGNQYLTFTIDQVEFSSFLLSYIPTETLEREKTISAILIDIRKRLHKNRQEAIRSS